MTHAKFGDGSKPIRPNQTYHIFGINIQHPAPQDGTCQLTGAGVAKPRHWSLLPAVQCPVTVLKACGRKMGGKMRKMKL